MNQKAYVEFVVEQLAPLGRITTRAMFGGHTLYCDDAVFALVANSVLYLKVDDANRPRFEAAGLEPFRPFGDQDSVMQYYQAPAELFESVDGIEHWEGALSRRAGAPRQARRRRELARVFVLHTRDAVEIRVLETRHAPQVYAVAQAEKEYLGEWLPWVETTHSIQDVESFIGKSLDKFTSNNGFDAGIWLDGALAGGIGLHFYDWANRRTEIGYWLSQGATGRGIMTDCCRTVIRYVFDDLHLHRVEIRCATGNAKSRHIPERLGFTLEGTLRKAQFLNGRYVDLAVYGLLRTDQMPSRSSAA